MFDKINQKPCIIFINARFLTRPVTGVERYAIEFVKALDKLLDQEIIKSSLYSFILIAPANIKYKLDLKKIRLKLAGFFKGHLWEQLELPFYSRKGILINLCNTAPVLNMNQIVTIHDASVYAFPQFYSLAFRSWYKIMFRILGILSKKIITVSFFSLGELTKYCKINPAKICVIYEGKEHILSVESDRTILGKSGIGKRPYVLAVSSLSPNKNFASIIRAIEIIGNPDFDIVIAGGTNPRVFSKSAIELPDFVKYVGYVTDNELRALYDHAGCFIYPSFYEGFGLPPLEALACGCPIIISNAASLPEVFQDGAIYCDPHSPQDIAEKIELIMSDKILRDNLRQKGFRRSNNLSWEKCAKEIFAVIEEVIAR